MQAYTYRLKFWFCIIALIVLLGCQQQKHKKNYCNKKQNILVTLKDQEHILANALPLTDEVRARLTDISLPHTSFIYTLTKPESCSQALVFVLEMNMQDACSWTKTEMKQWGWKLNMACVGLQQHAYVFVKPKRLCNILCEEVNYSKTKHTLVKLFIGQKINQFL